MNDAKHLEIARGFIGQKEIAGLQSNPWIMSLWDSVPWIWATVARKDDSVLPWCGAFINHIIILAGLPSVKKWWSAKAWLEFGVQCSPCLGAIGVLKNSKGQYHVTICVGVDNAGNVLGLGGNQNDGVRISAFKRDSFVGFRKPSNLKYKQLPNLKAELADSVS